MIIYDTSYCYAAIILHPGHGMAWFERHWKGYELWIKEVKTGMKNFVISFGDRLEENEAVVEVQEERRVARKLPNAVIERREEQRMLGLLDSDDDETVTPPPAAKRREFELRTKQSVIELELLAGTAIIHSMQSRILFYSGLRSPKIELAAPFQASLNWHFTYTQSQLCPQNVDESSRSQRVH